MKEKPNRRTFKSNRVRVAKKRTTAVQPPTRRTVRRALDVSDTTVRFCDWNGDDPHHAHAIYYLASGAVVSVGDDVPPEALGNHVAHHWCRRVGDKCLLA